MSRKAELQPSWSLLFPNREIVMIELGKKSECFGTERLVPLQKVYGRPTQLPYVPEGSKVICGYDQGLGERLFVCESVEDMQQLYDSYARGGALTIKWYSGDDPGFIQIIGGSAESTQKD